MPRVLSYGLSSPDFPLGPYIIMQHIEHCGSMSHALAMPDEENPNESHVLNPDVSEDALHAFYAKVAVHLLHLFRPSFTRIGSLVQTATNTFSVAGRPTTQNMNHML